ncbi:MAG: ATP-binding protein [Alphaproteobacteria bacterium]|nr:ATP-binding protein [Alphaproteobacteria bacterium]
MGATIWLALLPCLAFANDFKPAAYETDPMSALFYGLLIGAVLTAATYLFFIWMVMHDRGQVFLIIFLLCLSLNIFSANNLLMYRIGITDLNSKTFLSNLSLISSWISALYFSFYFLELDINAPGFKIPFIAIGIALLFVLFYSLIDHALIDYLLSMIGTIVIASILIAGLSAIQNGTSGSEVHTVAFGCFLMGVLAKPAYVLGYLETPEDVTSVTSLSFALSSMIFAIVIANQFAARQDEKEKELAVSNERFALATRGANEGLFDWNLMTGEIFFSDQFRKIVGYRLVNGPEGMKKWIRMIQRAYRLSVIDAFRRFRRNPAATILTAEYTVDKPNGDRRWFHSKAVAVRDRHSHKILRLVGSTSDITERKKSEVAVLASEARLRNIIEAHPVPVVISSLQTGRILFAAPGAEQFLKMRKEVIEANSVDRFLQDPEPLKNITSVISAGKSVDSYEATIVRGDDASMPVAISARPITYQQESAMVMGIYDLTERKKAEAQIAQQQEALQQSEKMAALGGLLAGVAHELNNPLSVVVGQSTLLMEGAPEAKVASRAEKIFKAADRCSRIVKSFLALARRKPPEHKIININQIVRGSLELLGYQFKTGEINIQSYLDPNVGDAIGDSDQMTQVVTNLVLNAAQAMDGWKGPRNITVTTAPGPKCLFLVVADTGPGIPHDIRTRVFEPFFTTKSGKGGTGVGLSLCLNIISAHGGELLLSDTSGGGATFTIKLPISNKDDENKDAAAGDTASESMALRLLLVDDEVELAQTLADLLEPLGHTVDIAANGEVAMEKLRKNKFDLIISDLRMPVMDGPALYESIEHELPSYKNRIIYVTGDTLSTHVQDFLGKHDFHVVEKPYRLKDIRRSIGDLMKEILKQGATG